MSRDGILLFSKQRGVTSFKSLDIIKKALDTRRIGHTGTLDSFADGLLVVLCGRLTRLVSRVTLCDKTYEALVRFGEETDTLDPEGRVVAASDIPAESGLASVLPRFLGSIEQVPPAYSAIHVQGQRASDLARKGKPVELAPRTVTISELTMISYRDGYAHLRVSCSSGTYIRSLARDIARACGSCCHLAALRRTRVGPFLLDAAAGCQLLEPFGMDIVGGTKDIEPGELKAALKCFTPELASSLGLAPVFLDAQYMKDFFNGKPISPNWFAGDGAFVSGVQYAVFAAEDGAARFLGCVDYAGSRPVYSFVMGQLS